MILVLLGPDAYRKRQRRGSAIADFDVPTSEVQLIDADSATLQALDDALLSLGLFATKKVVVIPAVGDLPKTVAGRLVELFPSISEETLVILEADKLDQRTELAKAVKNPPRSPFSKGGSSPLSKRGGGGDFVTETFEPLQGSLLDRWITDQAKTLGTTIDPDARRLLIERAGADSWRLRSELEKLSTAAITTTPSTITSAHVRELTLATTSPTLFALTDALTAGQPAKARIALAKLLAGGEAPLGIMGMLGYHLRTLVLVKDADRPSPSATERPAKLHPFVIKKHLPLTRRLSWERLSLWYEQLAAYDAAAKTGTMEPVVALELMVHELSAPTH